MIPYFDDCCVLNGVFSFYERFLGKYLKQASKQAHLKNCWGRIDGVSRGTQRNLKQLRLEMALRDRRKEQRGHAVEM
jgi:hypothetical protein